MTIYGIGYVLIGFMLWPFFTAMVIREAQREFPNESDIDAGEWVLAVCLGGVGAFIWPLAFLGFYVYKSASAILKKETK